MLVTAILLAAQAAAPLTPAAAEAQARKVLAARGVSPAGVDISIAIDKRHQPTLQAIVQRGSAAEAMIRAAVAKRPVDVEGFARGTAARADASAALAREAAQVAIEQMRALPAADRIVLVQVPTPAKR